MARARQGRAITAFNVVMLAIGGIALVVIVDHLGRAGIQRAVIGTGAWFLVIGAIDVASAMCDTAAIHAFLRPHGEVGYWRVFLAQISGMAINRLTPGHTLGEPVKVTTLVRWVPLDIAVPAIVRFNVITLYVGTAAIAIGVPITAAMLDLPDHVAFVVWIGMVGMLGCAIALAIIVRRGAVGTLIGGLVATGFVSAARGTRWRTRISEIDGHLRAPASRLGLVAICASRGFNWLGTIAVLHAAQIPLTAPLVIATLTVGILITWMSQVIPLGLGLADGSNYVLYGLLGASPEAGLVFTMINRLRTIAIAIVGLVVMASVNVVRRFLAPK